MKTSRAIDAICDQYVEDFATLDPLEATFAGIGGHDDRLPDLSPDGYAAREELTRSALAAAMTAEPADAREQIAGEAFAERLGLDVERAEAGIDRCAMNVLTSPLHAIRQAFDLMPRSGEEAWSSIDTRLAAIPETLVGYRVTLADEAARGNVVAARQYAEVAEQIRNWTGEVGQGGNFFTSLVAGAEVTDTLRSRLAAHAASASRAFADFGMFLTDELEHRGRANEAVGREEYALASRTFLGAAIDLEETYSWGWEELRRLTDEMTATAGRILPGSTIAEAVAHLDADPARLVHGREAFRDWMQELADRTIAELADTQFDIPQQIRTIECCLAPTNDGGIYYTGPSEDFTRPGRMWWSV